MCELVEGRAGLKKTSFCCHFKDALVPLIKCSVPLQIRVSSSQKGRWNSRGPRVPSSPWATCPSDWRKSREPSTRVWSMPKGKNALVWSLGTWLRMMNSCSELQGQGQLFQLKDWSCWPACLGLKQIIFYCLYFSRQKCTWEGNGPRKDPGMFNPLSLQLDSAVTAASWMAGSYLLMSKPRGSSLSQCCVEMCWYITWELKHWRKITMEVGGNNPCKTNVKGRNNLLLWFHEERAKTFETSPFQKHPRGALTVISGSLTEHLLKVSSVDSHSPAGALPGDCPGLCPQLSRTWGQWCLTWGDAQAAEQPSSALCCPSTEAVGTFHLAHQNWHLVRKVHSRWKWKIKWKG